MQAYSAFTSEIDDLEKAVEELAAQIAAQGKLAENSCGIVFCDYDFEVAGLAEALRERFAFPVIGNVGPAVFTRGRNAGGGIAMTVLTADDCWFRVGASGDLTGGNASGEVAGCYGRLADSAPDAPKLVMAFTPCNDRIVDDDVVMTLDRVSHGLPVFGGRACDDCSFTFGGVIANGRYLWNAAGILLIGGNVNPVFMVTPPDGVLNGFPRKVTRAEGCKIFEVDGKGFVDYLQEFSGVMELSDDARTNFLQTPFLVTRQLPGDDMVSFMLIMRKFSREENCGNFLSRVCHGDIMQRLVVDPTSIVSSARQAAQKVGFNSSLVSGYRHAVWFCISCCTRYWLSVNDRGAEVRELVANAPEGVKLSGFYSCGEFCPVRGSNSQRLHNVIHNETMAILAL